MISVADVITELYDCLNAASADDLQFWSVDDLYAYASEAAQKLARTAAIFVAQASVAVTGGTAVYANPDRHVALLAFAIGGLRLQPSSARQMAARSTAWEADVCDAGKSPTHWVTDIKGHDWFRLWPQPLTDTTLEITLAQFPAEITADSPSLAAPAIVGDYLADRIQAEARRQEGVAAMPEVARSIDQEAALLEQAFAGYWGAAI